VFYVDRVNGRTAQQMAIGPVHVESSGTFKVEGWAVDEPAQSTGTGVDVRVDGALFPSIYGLERQDVGAHFSRPAYLQSGFVAAVPSRGLGRGRHGLALRVAAADGRCAYETPEQPIVVD
jgi:hypothetical protein